ncbi:MAG TPA: ectonucleotide pyrophosphatase/phosphodiesterase [Sphingopyxis sp.]|nr:ectonucleotide pyrophosphatase/phosphodiesterase [Sphingopyxis sp.]
MKILKSLLCSAALVLGGMMMTGPAMALSPTAATPMTQKAPQERQARPVLLVSIDGLSPDSLFRADELGLKIPTLRALMAEGAAAKRMINVNPTVTNPNHISMITGTSPAVHGVFNNRPFIPAAKLPAGYRDYQHIKVPTLWSAAKAAGLRTASLFWPVTQNSGAAIDHNVITGSSTDDAAITRDAIAIMERAKPELMTVHYVSHDAAQHKHGPWTPEAFASLERIDAELGQLIAAHKRLYNDPIMAVASDHGFFQIRNRVHLNSAFVEAGLIRLDENAENGVSDWRAFAWYVGGMAMIVLKDPANVQLRAEVDAFLAKLAKRPDAAIDRIYTREELQGRGLSDQAQYVIALKEGHHMGTDMTGLLLRPYQGGAHGAFTASDTRTEMHAAFIIAGKGIASGQDLGTIDIRQIAPTLAQYLAISLPTAQLKPITLRQSQ